MNVCTCVRVYVSGFTSTSRIHVTDQKDKSSTITPDKILIEKNFSFLVVNDWVGSIRKQKGLLMDANDWAETFLLLLLII